MHHAPARGFSLIEALVLIVVLLMLMSLVMPTSYASRTTSRKMQNATQLRGIHQGMVIYAQSNREWYPGLKPDGTNGNLSVGNRLLLLLDIDAFTPEYIINPHEYGSKTEWQPSTPLTTDHYSYAMLQVPDKGARRDEWRETLNTQAVVLSDRNTGTADAPTSIFSDGTAVRSSSSGRGFSCSCSSRQTSQSSYNYTGWAGGVVRNDNSTGFETTHLLDLKYDKVETKDDHLFETAGEDDAYLIYSGN